MVDLPYFDLLLKARRGADPAALLFDRFVHWGYWDQPPAARPSAAEFQLAMRRLDDLVVGAGGVADGQAILDAGCGFGGTLMALNDELENVSLVGVNIDRRQIEAALPGVSPRQGNSLTLVCADACRLPLAAARFDAVLAVECIFHFPSRLAFLAEAARVLKPGGCLALSDFVPRDPGARQSPIGRWIERKIGEGYGRLGDGWRDGNYQKMAEKAGLEIIADRDITGQTLPTYPFLLKLIKRGPMMWPTRLLYWVSALGLVRYRVVTFRKPTVATRVEGKPRARC